MKSFKISEPANKLKGLNIKPNELSNVLKLLSDSEKNAIIHQWMSEGIPYCFSDCPMLYEFTRDWLGTKINIHPKQITLIGSGRFGFSLVPKHYGRPFDKKSDLDFTIISLNLFRKAVDDFDSWLGDYSRGIIKPVNECEKKLWDENARNLPTNIKNGFIDHYKVPTIYPTRYPTIHQIEKTLDRLHLKLKKTNKAPVIRKLSLRIFKNWNSATRQFDINLTNTIVKIDLG